MNFSSTSEWFVIKAASSPAQHGPRQSGSDPPRARVQSVATELQSSIFCPARQRFLISNCRRPQRNQVLIVGGFADGSFDS